MLRTLACLALAGLPLACGRPAPPPVAPVAAAAVAGPIRLLSHADPAEELLVFDHRPSRAFVRELGPILDAVNRDRLDAVNRDRLDAVNRDRLERGRSARPIGLVVLQWRYDRGRAEVETNLTPVTRIEVATRFDVWLQDFAELAVRPGPDGEPRTVLLDPQRGVGLERFAPELALRWGADWVRLPRAAAGARSGAGNVEALPNGLVLLGSTAGEAWPELLLAQDPGIGFVRVDTGWLSVGHVDEVVSHVVTGAGACDFALVRASPGLALELAPGASERETRHQRVIEARLAASLARVAEALAAAPLACPDVPVVSLPVSFGCDEADGAPIECRSQRPNPVNLTALDRHLLVPDPGEPFREATRRALASVGQRVHLLDARAWHARQGGVHCATNVRRRPRSPLPAAAPRAVSSAPPSEPAATLAP